MMRTQGTARQELIETKAKAKHGSEPLKAVENLKDFAYEVCPLHKEDDLEEIVCSL